MLRFISWNLNGLRSCLGKGLLDYIDSEKADFYCFQEVRATIADAAKVAWPAGYHFYGNEAQKKGYSGTAILSRKAPLSVELQMGLPEADAEGRIVAAEFEDFYLISVYVPNSKRELTRLSLRQHQWDPQFCAYLKKLELHKPVIVCGDFNCAHTEIDLANPAPNVKNAGFTPEERMGFGRYLESGFIDTFRHFHPDESGHYTWWTFRSNARARNIGWRIDYFLVSESLKPRMSEAYIRSNVMGSDHCPIGLVLA